MMTPVNFFKSTPVFVQAIGRMQMQQSHALYQAPSKEEHAASDADGRVQLEARVMRAFGIVSK